MKRHQRGYVYKANGAWHLRYRDLVLQDGAATRKQVSRKLADIAEYRTKSEVMPLAEEFLSGLNTGNVTADSTMTLDEFWTQIFEPRITAQLKHSSQYTYNQWYRSYIKPYLASSRLRDIRTVDLQHFIESLHRKHDISKNTLRGVRALLNSMFKHAKRSGVLHTANPVAEIELPRQARGKRKSEAYDINAITRMLKVLPEPSRTIVGIAAFTGLRISEIRALRWEDYDGHTLNIQRNAWRTHIQTPKTASSAGTVPVIPALARILDSQRKPAGWIFPGRKAELPALIHSRLVNTVLKPVLSSLGLAWHGYHAFRRGLATNLHALGVADKEIQAILRHSDIKTTQNIYIQSTAEGSLNAMAKLETALGENGMVN